MMYLGDCLELMKNIPDKSVDLVVTDPPYRVEGRGNAGSMGGFMTSQLSKKGMIFQYNNVRMCDYLAEFYRVLKNDTHCYVMCNNYNLIEMLNTSILCGFKFVKNIIWKKPNKLCSRYYMSNYEYVIFLRKGKDKQINNCSTPDVIETPFFRKMRSNGKNLHDTEKPVELMKILIENSTKEGDIVMDPFMGIGSTGIAARDTKRIFLGIEKDRLYFETACERMKHRDLF